MPIEAKAPEAAARDDDYDLIRPPILRHFSALVRELGADPGPLLAPYGIAPEDCDRPAIVTCRQWISLLEAAARRLDLPTFGLMLAERQGGNGLYGQLGTAMSNARNFGEALRYAVDHHAAHSLGARVWMGQTASGDHVFVGHDIVVDGGSDRSQAIEQVLLAGHLGARFLTGDRVGVRRVHFRHRPGAPLATYQRYFGCEGRFCQNEDGVAFARAALDAPVIDADCAAFRRVAAEIERSLATQRPPLQASVRGIVMQWLATDSCSIDQVAAALDLHPRTLARHLRAEGTSFLRVKDEVRCDAMLYYLRETPLELSAISEKLGFAEQSVMSRFARARLGAAPSALRAGAVKPEAE